MYKCNYCGHIFSSAATEVETHGFSSGPYEHYSVCPNCRQNDFEEYVEPESYDPDIAEVSKKIIEGIFYLNNLNYQIEDVFGGGALNENLNKGYQCLIEALHIISAEEGMDENIETLVLEAKVLDNKLDAAIKNFLEGAGLE